MLIPAVFLLSLSSIAFEVLLTRTFSISQWNHLSFMVISIALFGFAASGTLLSMLNARLKGTPAWLYAGSTAGKCILLYMATAIISFAALNNIPLDYFRLPLEPVQGLYLLIAYALLALPFFFAGLVISLAYSCLPESSGVVYCASMGGSAAGALLPIPLLPLLGEGPLIVLTALIPSLAFFFSRTAAVNTDRLANAIRWKRKLIVITVLVTAAFLTVSSGLRAMFEVGPSPYKALSQILQFPQSRILATTHDIRGRIDQVASPYIRFAPGLSLKFTDLLPEQWALYRDGDNPLVFYNLRIPLDADFARNTVSFAGYSLIRHPEEVLLIQQNGGLGMACAVASGARNITLLEQNPRIAETIAKHYHLRVLNQNPRAFLAHTGKRFQIIQVENWGSSLPGTAALTQAHLFTREAFSQYYNHLTDTGILILSRKLLLPPSDSLRLWATAYESLKALGLPSPEKHMAMLRNWDTFTLLIRAQPFKEVTGIANFARALNFDLVYLPEMTKQSANRYNLFDMPYHYLEIDRMRRAYLAGTASSFFAAYPLDIAPQSDNRPFPARFFKWHRFYDYYRSTGSRPFSLFLSGEIVVAVVFAEALLLSVLLLILPIRAVSRKMTQTPLNRIAYFLAIGAGFMFVELFLIKKYILLFDDPVISLTVVLAGMLIASGAGGYWSQKIPKAGLRSVLIVLVALLVFLLIGLDPFLYRILRVSVTWRYFWALVLLLPLGCLLGLPFPLGMRYLLDNPSQRAYAWAANGCASVLGSVASAQIGLGWGLYAIMLCAVLAYGLAFLSMSRSLKKVWPGDIQPA